MDLQEAVSYAGNAEIAGEFAGESVDKIFWLPSFKL